MNLRSYYQDYLKNSLTKSELLTLQLLIWLLQVHKQVKIERLGACLPIPILYESRRRKIQRFLKSKKLSLSLFWFPLIKLIIEQEFKGQERLVLVLDRTQWKSNNIIMISVIWRKRALPIYWLILNKKGRSSLSEQQAIIRPILKLLSDWEIVILGDREFHGIELAYWLKQQDKKRKNPIYFAFREKGDVNFKKGKKGYQTMKELCKDPGFKAFYSDVEVTKKKGFGKFNLGFYWKRNYKNYKEKQPWFILTNLPSLNETIKYYRKRSGIEAMFKDCKTGGYNLEGSQANQVRLTNLILLIAIAYTNSALKGKSIKNQGHQKYITRLREARRKNKRHSDFWVGLYGDSWIFAVEFCFHFIQELMALNKNKLTFYQKGMKVYSKISAIS
ncbi:transposase IS4 family protein (plasmid) [Gloeothece citriformis PCC 7424]|uniref:Transposase IS4 family protein n=1 Tax=Gloeothece citriformis (strain PCC 7424) TaxID=65393 RepID=B7KME5_GLOC7|nr:IS4 family transposase [Gloeothece citriformis]ACK73967.1 transposase IS4 family protein [Gloeothece citriformis PCC 7424]ACK74084.1 transposase IS4 family protein [Gloeothece citriformis PCC 7424]